MTLPDDYLCQTCALTDSRVWHQILIGERFYCRRSCRVGRLSGRENVLFWIEERTLRMFYRLHVWSYATNRVRIECMGVRSDGLQSSLVNDTLWSTGLRECHFAPLEIPPCRGAPTCTTSRFGKLSYTVRGALSG